MLNASGLAGSELSPEVLDLVAEVATDLALAIHGHRAVRRRRVAETRLGLALEASGAGVYEHRVPIDASTFFSERWAEILGHPLDEVPTDRTVVRWLLEKVHPDDLEGLLEGHRAFVEGRVESYRAIARLRHRSGRWVYVRNLATAVKRDASGRAARVVGLMLDVSDEMRSVQQLRRSLVELERSNRELERFAYVASHDLQEPLRAVTGCVQLLQRLELAELDEDAGRLMDMAVGGALRMKTLIDELLRWARVGQERPHEPVDLQAVVVQVLDALAPAVAEGRAEVRIGELPVVHGNAAQLSQVFQNVISNALRFAGDAPASVEVSARRSGESWICAVEDNGAGIAAEDLERIFVLFERLQPSRGRPGSGIGLAVCRRIIEHHGGEIWAESEPGLGTILYFTLPAAGGAHAEATVAVRAARRGMRPGDDASTVGDEGPAQATGEAPELELLLVEDSDADAFLIDVALQTCGASSRLHRARDGVEALEFLRRQGGHQSAPRPDLILLDLNLPRRHGLDVLSEIKSDLALRTIPVAILTTSDYMGDVRAAYERHANCYVIKPVDLDAFTTVVGGLERFWRTGVRLP